MNEHSRSKPPKYASNYLFHPAIIPLGQAATPEKIVHFYTNHLNQMVVVSEVSAPTVIIQAVVDTTYDDLVKETDELFEHLDRSGRSVGTPEYWERLRNWVNPNPWEKECKW